MNTSDLEARLFAVLGALAFLGVPTLGLREFFLILVEELGIAHDFTRRRAPQRTSNQGQHRSCSLFEASGQGLLRPGY